MSTPIVGQHSPMTVGQTYFAAAAVRPKVNVQVAPLAVNAQVPRSNLAKVVQTIVPLWE